MEFFQRINELNRRINRITMEILRGGSEPGDRL